MSWFKHKHEPDSRLQGESKMIEDSFSDYLCGRRFYTRVKVTNHVCLTCNVHYVTRHKIDEVSAEVGPRIKPGPEKSEESE